MNTSRLLGLAGIGYFGLALLCLFAPNDIPVWIANQALLLGPPVFFVWGWGAWPWFAAFTIILALLVIAAVRFTETGRAVATLFAALFWILAGFLSYAFSI